MFGIHRLKKENSQRQRERRVSQSKKITTTAARITQTRSPKVALAKEITTLARRGTRHVTTAFLNTCTARGLWRHFSFP